MKQPKKAAPSRSMRLPSARTTPENGPTAWGPDVRWGITRHRRIPQPPLWVELVRSPAAFHVVLHRAAIRAARDRAAPSRPNPREASRVFVVHCEESYLKRSGGKGFDNNGRGVTPAADPVLFPTGVARDPALASHVMKLGKRRPIAFGVLLAVASALAFGVTTPLIARFGREAGPFTTAALLYVGAALSSIVARPLAKTSGRALGRSAVPRLLLIALFGAALAPTLLAGGLARAGATGSSLVLNFEAIFTVLLARIAYREHIGLRVGLAVVVMSVGGALIGFDATRTLDKAHLGGLLLVLAATASWALDNTLTRGLAEENPLDVVAAKAGLGASATTGLAIALGESLPGASGVIALLACGAAGYGFSLLLYLQAQRHIGAVRTGSVFATGPFVGAGLAWLLGDRQAGWATAFGALAFGVGVLLHLTERHSHAHVHHPLDHEHPHRHDDGHHEHQHEPAVAGEHTHWHQHELAEHEHEHAPDIHHGHGHS